MRQDRQTFQGSSLLEGLRIDDYFVIAIEDKDSSSRDPSCLGIAKKACFDLLGSDDKDFLPTSQGKVVGAYIDGGDTARSFGLVNQRCFDP